MVEVDTFGTGAICADDCLADAVRLVFGLTPSEIIAQLDLLMPSDSASTETVSEHTISLAGFPTESVK